MKQKSECGAGLAAVMIMSAFLMLLASGVMISAHYNINMKAAEAAAERDFYVVDSKVDAAVAALEKRVRDEIKSVYLEFVANAPETINNPQTRFAQALAKRLEGELQPDGTILLAKNAALPAESIPDKMVYNKITGSICVIVPSLVEWEEPDTLEVPYSLIAAGDVTLGNTSLKGDSYTRSSYLVTGDAAIADTTWAGNDLVVRGGNATLFGNYYGFGNSRTEGNQSSAILIDTLGSGLDLTGLSSLRLSGTAFIDYAAAEDIPLGGSLTAKSDELAFLLPETMILYNGAPISNPFLRPNDYDEAKLTVIDPTVTFVTRTEPTYAQTQHLVYVFRTFAGQADRNAFFAANASAVADYLRQYLRSYALSGANPLSDGTVWNNDRNGVQGGDVPQTVLPPDDCEMFLSWANTTDDLAFRDPKGVVLARVSSADLAITDPSIRFVISKGAVTVKCNVAGTIIAGGKVMIADGASVSYVALDSETLAAVSDDGDTLLAYLQRNAVASGIWIDRETRRLVFVQNYTKNED